MSDVAVRLSKDKLVFHHAKTHYRTSKGLVNSTIGFRGHVHKLYPDLSGPILLSVKVKRKDCEMYNLSAATYFPMGFKITMPL